MEAFIHLVCIAVASFAITAQPAVAQGASTTNSSPLTYPGRVLQRVDNQTCPSEEQQKIARNKIKTATRRLLRQSVIPNLQDFFCDGSTGWRLIAYLNMSDPSQQCPSAWQEIPTPHRVCGRKSASGGCEGLTYSTGSEQYDQVCGRIIGYQLSTPDAFCGSSRSIDSYYLDGVSVTYGSPRQHIWSFAGGLDEDSSGDSGSSCGCVTGSTNRNHIPLFVGQNYFCESGITRWDSRTFVFWRDGDPLWDGQGCGLTSSCCTFNSPPWFSVRLPSPTSDDIEVRICGHGGIGDEDTPIQLIELYIK